MRESSGPPGQHIILYDGVCGLCNRFNLFVLSRDTKQLFRFAALQSNFGREAIHKRNRNPENLDTLYVVANYRSESSMLLERSQAALFVMKCLGRPWSWVGIVSVLPDRLLDWAYNRVAGVRYRIFGRYDTCPMPSPENRSRFIDL